MELYKNGVGFFEHSGKVTGDQSVTINFTSAQLNDVLQSLTAVDLNGGRISGAGYNSTTPLDQQLLTLPLALSADPSDVDFYNAIRGARVQVSGLGVNITGRLLAIDLRAEDPKVSNPHTTVSRRFITVVSDLGADRHHYGRPGAPARNMKALKGSPEEKALLTRYTGELNGQEDRLVALNKEIAALQMQRAAADAEFQTKLEGLNLDENL